MKKHFTLFLLLAIIVTGEVFSQKEKKEYLVSGVGFYNLENLFDTLIDPDPNKILQDDFTPKGKKAWSSKNYQEKLVNMAKVISDLGTDVSPDGMAILGVSEVENKSVLEDLVKSESIKNRGYKVVHYDCIVQCNLTISKLQNKHNLQKCIISMKDVYASCTMHAPLTKNMLQHGIFCTFIVALVFFYMIQQ